MCSWFQFQERKPRDFPLRYNFRWIFKGNPSFPPFGMHSWSCIIEWNHPTIMSIFSQALRTCEVNNIENFLTAFLIQTTVDVILEFTIIVFHVCSLPPTSVHHNIYLLCYNLPTVMIEQTNVAIHSMILCVIKSWEWRW